MQHPFNVAPRDLKVAYAAKVHRSELPHDPISFVFNDEPVSALRGETIAAALTANGHQRYRLTINNQPRGLFCGMGVCYDCLVVVNGKRSQRACMTEVEDGMTVCVQHEGRDSENSTELADPPESERDVHTPDVLIVGAGPAGLAAALVASGTGLAVTILDERPYPGGQYYKPLARSHAVSRHDALDSQFSAGHSLLHKVTAVGACIETATTVWGASRNASGELEIDAIRNGLATLYRPKQLIIATGAYERPWPVPGWTLPGVITTGAAQTLARSYRVAPGERILVAGNGPLNLQVACELIRGGANVVAVIEAARSPWRQPVRAIRSAWYAPRLVGRGLGYLAALIVHALKSCIAMF